MAEDDRVREQPETDVDVAVVGPMRKAPHWAYGASPEADLS
jgi:hypothetical protein